LRTAISKGLVNRNVRYAAELGLVYLNNPKAGCSTVKFSLWTALDALNGKTSFGGNVHARHADPFVRDVFALGPQEAEKFGGARIFSIVRNPYSRVLAAYLDKIPHDPVVWAAFRKGFGLRPDLTRDEFSFRDFLRLVDVAAPDLLDGHFRPQVANLLMPHAKPDFIGYLEDMESVKDYLAGFGVAVRDHVPHATNSLDRLEEDFDPETVELTNRIYAEDFTSFGYSVDIADARRPGGPPPHDQDDPDLIKLWVTSREAPADVQPDLTDLRAFGRTRDREKKRMFITQSLARDCDWFRLKRYARFARKRLGENDLSDALLEKMARLRAKYEQAVSAPSIFAPM
jgi:hypothetical protein